MSRKRCGSNLRGRTQGALAEPYKEHSKMSWTSSRNHSEAWGVYSPRACQVPLVGRYHHPLKMPTASPNCHGKFLIPGIYCTCKRDFTDVTKLKILRWEKQSWIVRDLGGPNTIEVAWVVKNTPANAGDPGWIPGSGRSPGEGHGNLLQYSCLENPTDNGAWRATVHRVAKSRTRLKWLSMHAIQSQGGSDGQGQSEWWNWERLYQTVAGFEDGWRQGMGSRMGGREGWELPVFSRS